MILNLRYFWGGVAMIKADYDWGTDPAAQLAELKSSGSSAPQTDDDRKIIPDLELEWVISNARLKEKQLLDARFAKIIGIVHEPRQLVKRTITTEFRANN
jgi:hypothetical protein